MVLLGICLQNYGHNNQSIMCTIFFQHEMLHCLRYSKRWMPGCKISVVYAQIYLQYNFVQAKWIFELKISISSVSGLDDTAMDASKQSISINEIVKIDQKELHERYYHISTMQKMQRKSQELLLLDATYRLNDLSMPLYVLMVEDGNEESQVVATE